MFKDTTVRYCQLLGAAAWMVSMPAIAAEEDAPMHCLTAEEVEVLLLESFPSLVLSGTEVISVDDFTPANEQAETSRVTFFDKLSAALRNQSEVNHTYYTEIGGAELNLSVSGSLPHLTVQRQYQESGQIIEAEVFRNVCYQNGIIHAENLIGWYVSEGLLLLEKQANVSGIPQDMWVFYPTAVEEGVE